MRPDGSELKRVSAVPGGLWYPAWSPDGSELSVCTQEGARRIGLRQPVAEAGARRLPPIDETHLFRARSWTPDGTALAGIAIGPGSVWRGIHVLSLASGAYRRLGDQSGPDVLSLDAGRLVVGTPREILVVDAQSGEARGLARGQNPSLSADGRWLTSLDQSGITFISSMFRGSQTPHFLFQATAARISMIRWRTSRASLSCISTPPMHSSARTCLSC